MRLEVASKNTANWSDKIEKSKYNTNNSGSRVDRGYIGHQSAKMMKRAKVMEKRIEKAMDEKSKLLNNIEKKDSLKLVPLNSRKNPFILAKDLQIQYENRILFDKISFEVSYGDRIAIMGKNGVGKSSLLKLLLGEKIEYSGTLKISNDLKVSYVPQSTENLKGSLKTFARVNKIEESIFKAMLSKMGVPSLEFEKDMQNMSEGQKKKILLAKSISESANIYIWDEPLNYIDVLTRIQIEEAVLSDKPTLIFAEHDETFVEKVATKKIKVCHH